MRSPVDFMFTDPRRPVGLGALTQTIGRYLYGTEQGERMVLGCPECGSRTEGPVGDEAPESVAVNFGTNHFHCRRDAHPGLDKGWEEVLVYTLSNFLKYEANHAPAARLVFMVPEDVEGCEEFPTWWETSQEVPASCRYQRALSRHKIEAYGTRPEFAFMIQPEVVEAGGGVLTTHRIEVTVLTDSHVLRYTLRRDQAEVVVQHPWSFTDVARREAPNPLCPSLEGLILRDHGRGPHRGS